MGIFSSDYNVFFIIGGFSISLFLYLWYKVRQLENVMKSFFQILSAYFFGYVVYFSLNILSAILGYFKEDWYRRSLNSLQCSYSSEGLSRFLIVFVIVVIVIEILSCLKTFYQYVFVAKIKKHVNDVLLTRILSYDDSFFSKNSDTTILTGMKNVIDGVDDASYFLKKIVKSGADFVSIMLLFRNISPIFIVINVTWIVIWQSIIFVFTKKAYSVYAKICDERYKLNRNLGDIFLNIMTIKTFSTSNYEDIKNKEASRLLFEAEKSSNNLFLISNLFSVSLFLIFFSINVYYLKKMDRLGICLIGNLTVLLTSIIKIFSNIDAFSDNIMELSKMFSQIDEGMKLVYLPVKKTINSKEKLDLNGYDLILKNIEFYYNKNNFLKIDGEIFIKEGWKVAVVGPSGGGKTTFFKILLGLLTPEKGEIIVDGNNILEYSKDALKDIFALVPQDVELFHRTILENLKYGTFSANMEKVEAIMQKIKLVDVIESMEYGYNSIVGENNGLSGGQKQRIAIARGLLKQAKIFLFDESTSALDFKTENDVLETIDEITNGYTRFVIAHRLKTVEDADLILVFDKGLIVEKGTHRELLKKNGLYASLMELCS